MAERTFSIEEALRFGWSTAERNFGLLLKLIGVSLLVYAAPGFVSEILRRDFPLFASLIDLAVWVVGTVVSLGWVRASLMFADGKTPEIGDLFPFELLVSYFFASVLFAVITTIGFIFLIVPGVILAVRFMFYSYLIADRGIGSLEALSESGKATAGVKGQLFLYGLVVGAVNFIGVLALGVGLLVTVPVTAIATAHIYRKLSR